VININNKSGKRGYDNQTAKQREQHAGAVEKERRYCRKYLLINLNLIVDRPDGLIKEGNNLSAGDYLMSSGK
jgi:hypothetical protein